MKLIQSLNETARNAAEATEMLNQAVINDESTSAALQALAGFVGAKRAQMQLDHAMKAKAEKNARSDGMHEGVFLDSAKKVD